jgi:WD40 repeat protein
MSQGKISFVCMTGARKIKTFCAPSTISSMSQSDQPSLDDAIIISDAGEVAEGHEKKVGRLVLSASKDWVFSWSEDGNISVRTLIDLEKPLIFSAHSFSNGGVYDIVVSEDCRVIYSLGSDSLIRVWEWKYTSSGKRNAIEASNAAKSLYEEQGSVLTEYANNLISFRYLLGSTSLSDSEDDSTGQLLAPITAQNSGPVEDTQHETNVKILF